MGLGPRPRNFGRTPAWLFRRSSCRYLKGRWSHPRRAPRPHPQNLLYRIRIAHDSPRRAHTRPVPRQNIVRIRSPPCRSVKPHCAARGGFGDPSPFDPRLIHRQIGQALRRYLHPLQSHTRFARQFIRSSPASGATFTPTTETFINLKYIHGRWATCYVPPHFLGLEEDPVHDMDMDMGEASDADTESTMEWEIEFEEEPRRRLLPHEFEQEPVVKFRRLLASDDDSDEDPEDPEEFVKDDETARSWLEGIESWAETAHVVDDAEMLVNDGQIEMDSNEGVRVATSLDLTKPDYLSKPKFLSKRKVRPTT
ncbi:hypothetical protein B0H17DRAFT_1046718 [Mycena rosella]|uniref:Uncharacterized protein n=1 Tax=Mycena rosella TaxID=1033263 RepID=A0AAD7DWT8_MYCRO|nr:hypothetical protein B0H17DRAFT_1046718 [Mycena rosella]